MRVWGQYVAMLWVDLCCHIFCLWWLFLNQFLSKMITGSALFVFVWTPYFSVPNRISLLYLADHVCVSPADDLSNDCIPKFMVVSTTHKPAVHGIDSPVLSSLGHSCPEPSWRLHILWGRFSVTKFPTARLLGFSWKLHDTCRDWSRNHPFCTFLFWLFLMWHFSIHNFRMRKRFVWRHERVGRNFSGDDEDIVWRSGGMLGVVLIFSRCFHTFLTWKGKW